ncbi:MAG TPA: sensor histidine kinase [Dehalococcoidia bacterium]|nr:sensor histidine kinase [Dehalococcoidia bacterium]
MKQVLMDIAANIGSQKPKGVLYNRHFWIIACVMAGLVLLYNGRYVGIAHWFPWLEEVVSSQGIHAFVLSFLFLIPLTYASAVFRLRGTFITWALFLTTTLPRTLYESPNFESLLRVALFALVALLLGMFVALDYNPRPKEEPAKQARIRRLASLARFLKIQEYERHRLARELHDNTIQSLLVITNRAHALEAGDYGELAPEAKKQAEQIVVMLLHTIDDVRRLSRDLRPSILDNIGLLPALRWLTDSLSQESGIGIEVRINGREHRLQPEFELIIFRITQEALKNVVQHSRATRATVSLDFVKDNFKLTIEDDGQGFRLPQRMSDFAAKGKLGLHRIEQQARLIDGSFHISSQPGKGTVVTVEAKP